MAVTPRSISVSGYELRVSDERGTISVHRFQDREPLTEYVQQRLRRIFLRELAGTVTRWGRRFEDPEALLAGMTGELAPDEIGIELTPRESETLEPLENEFAVASASVANWFRYAPIGSEVVPYSFLDAVNDYHDSTREELTFQTVTFSAEVLGTRRIELPS
jgi:hypothetical protein